MKGFTIVEVCIVFAILGILGALIIGLPTQEKEHEDFLAACMRAGEQPYECQYKWKQMHPDPIVVYAPFNR